MGTGVGSGRHELAGVPLEQLPAALAVVHGGLAVGATARFVLAPDRPEDGWSVEDVIVGAGFRVTRRRREADGLAVVAGRERTLADRVAPGLRLLVCGLNPSEYAADRGVPFARPGNRFWPTLLAAGLADHDRDPDRALTEHGVGFTDLVKRATRRAAELTPSELRDGAGRVERLVRRLQPQVVCFLGITGYRTAVDPRAGTGLQPDPFAGRPVFVLGNPSGLNAHTTAAALAADLRRAAAHGEGAGTGRPAGSG